MNLARSLLAYCLDLDSQSKPDFLSELITECGRDIDSLPFYEWLKKYSLTAQKFEETLESRLGRILHDYFLSKHALMGPEALRVELLELQTDPAIVASYEDLFSDLRAVRRSLPQFIYIKEKVKEERMGGELSGIALNFVSHLEQHKIHEAYEELRRQIFRLDPQVREGEKTQSLKELAESRWDLYLDGKAHPEKYRGLFCGIREIDRATNGFLPGEVIVFTARTGVGKSLVLLHIARYCWERGKNVLFCTREMTVEQQFYRLNVIRLGERTALQGGGHFDAYRLRDFKLDPSQEVEYKKLLLDYKESEGQIIFVPPERCATPSLIDIELESLSSRGIRIDLCAIDYLQILNPSQQNERLSKPEKLGTIAWELKFMAQRRKCPIVTAMQDNRGAVADPRSGVETIAWSDDVPGVADLTVRIQTNEELREKNKLAFRATKGRNIALVEFLMDFYPERLWIGNPGTEIHDEESILENFNKSDLGDFPDVWE